MGGSAKDLCDLDERVLCGGAKSERRLVFFSTVEKAEHIVGVILRVVRTKSYFYQKIANFGSWWLKSTISTILSMQILDGL
jgi:hypothetical protein